MLRKWFDRVRLPSKMPQHTSGPPLTLFTPAAGTGMVNGPSAVCNNDGSWSVTASCLSYCGGFSGFGVSCGSQFEGTCVERHLTACSSSYPDLHACVRAAHCIMSAPTNTLIATPPSACADQCTTSAYTPHPPSFYTRALLPFAILSP